MSFSDHEVRLWLAANVDVARQDGTAELAEMGESALAAFDRLRARVAELEAAGDRVADQFEKTLGACDYDEESLIAAWRSVRREGSE